MNTSKPPAIAQWMPSLGDVAFLVPMLLLFSRMNGIPNLLSDGDTGWHIRAGEWMLANGQVPHRDLFSFTRADAPWFAWEWLWDVCFALLHRVGGLELVSLASLAVIGFTFLLLYRLALRQSGNCLIAIGITTLATICSSVHWLARPHLFTLLFSVVFLWILFDARIGNTRPLLWLPLLMLLWTNLHGGFIAGILITGCFAAEPLLRAIFVSPNLSRDQRERSGSFPGSGSNPAQTELPQTSHHSWVALRQAKPFLLAAIGCLAATLVNPYGLALHAHIAEYLTDGFHTKVVDEMQSLDFHHPGAPYFELMLVLGVLAAAHSFRKGRYAEPLLIAFWLHGALFASRNLPIYAIVSAPIIARMIAEWLSESPARAQRPALQSVRGWFERRVERMAPLEVSLRLPWLSASAIGLAALVMFGENAPAKFQAEFDPSRYPVAALQSLQKAGGPGRIFTHDEWGDYIIYRLYPTTKVFVDGRSDFYGPRFCERYLDVMRVRHDWERTLTEYEVDTVLLPVKTALTGTLKESPRWSVSFDDGVAIVFQRVSSLPRYRAVSESGEGASSGSPGSSGLKEKQT